MISNAFWWALATAVIWGIVPVLEKFGLAQSDPAIGVFARSAGVCVGALVFALACSPWKALANLAPASWILLAAGGFLASFVGQWAFYHALKVGAVSQVTPVAGAYPLVAALLAWIIFREPVTLPRLAGIALIVVGVLLLRR